MHCLQDSGVFGGCKMLGVICKMGRAKREWIGIADREVVPIGVEC